VKAFQEELTHLINRHSIENVADMPDFILADMICRMIEAIGPKVKHTLDWHGCSSVCHPKPITPDCQLGKECLTPMRECPECAKEYLAAKKPNNLPITPAPDRMTYAELSEQYHELIMAVERKFPGESRHETAVRYIREREARATAGPVSANP
jgi:hypothetical protein